MPFYYVPQPEEFQEGEIKTVDSPQGITWVHFPEVYGLDWRRVYDYDHYTTREGYPWDDVDIEVPVATVELQEAGIPIRPGQSFWAYVDARARDRGDVKPHDFSNLE